MGKVMRLCQFPRHLFYCYCYIVSIQRVQHLIAFNIGIWLLFTLSCTTETSAAERCYQLIISLDETPSYRCWKVFQLELNMQGYKERWGLNLATIGYLLSKNLEGLCLLPCMCLWGNHLHLTVLVVVLAALNDFSCDSLIAFTLALFPKDNYFTFKISIKNFFNCNYPMHFFEKVFETSNTLESI